MFPCTRSAVVGLGLALGLAGAASAGPSEDAAASYERGDFAAALAAWKPLADAGDASALYNIARLYDAGEGVAQDRAEAARWYGKAANLGNAEAQFALGVDYDTGEGLAVDKPAAAAWYRRAADQGHAGAMFNLGLMSRDGEGLPRDRVAAYKWFALALDRFDPLAQKDEKTQAEAALDDMEIRLSIAELAEARAQVAAWRPRAETPEKP
jgi:TPR repeat protein